jgi:hypothetical protein
MKCVSSVLLWVSCVVLLFAMVRCAAVRSSAMAAGCGVLLQFPYGMRTSVERFGVLLGGTGRFSVRLCVGCLIAGRRWLPFRRGYGGAI